MAGVHTLDRSDPYYLNRIMEFDHVIQVHPDGTVTDGPEGVYAPELFDGAIAAPWTLLDGYSGQYSYSGPIMHPSEFIGGDMARDILDRPGLYVALVSTFPTDDDDEDNADGWAVAYREATQDGTK